jgi:AmmeMemoRadiSam system protein B
VIRNPVVAGMFYPGSATALRQKISEFVDDSATKENVAGLVSPHAGYMYSGAVAGAVISRVIFKDTFVIMGPNHTGMGQPFSIMAEGLWKTPLGDVEIDTELASAIIEMAPSLQADHVAHLEEHSIEVQLPFLQYFKQDVKIVPIILARGTGDIYKEIGQGIAAACRELRREVVVMASSDMNHYESHHIANEKDSKAIEAILALDEDELLKRVAEFRISMCGYGPTVALLSSCKEMGATVAELVSHQTSGDVTGDRHSVVGYAGILIKRR